MKNVYKKVSLVAIVGVVAGLFWFWVKPWIEAPTRFSEVNIWLMPVIGLVVLASLIGLAFLFLKNRGWQVLVSVAAGFPFLIVFGFNPFYLAAFVLMIVIYTHAANSTQAEANERTKINIASIMQRCLPIIITPLLVMISFAFYFSPANQASAKAKRLPPTIQQVIEKTVSTFFGQQLDSLPPQQKKQAENQMVAEVTKQFTSFLGPYFQFFPPILAFGLFLVLQGLSFVFVWLAIALAVLIFWVLKKAGLVRLNVVQKEAEELVF